MKLLNRKPQTAPAQRSDSGKERHPFPRRSNRSRIGASAMAVLSVVFIVLSYRLQSVVFEINSVIAFAAAIILIFKDQSVSVQMRIVDRIVSSSDGLIGELSSYSFEDTSFEYSPEGAKVSDVAIVPLKAPAAGPVDPGAQTSPGIAPPASPGIAPPASPQDERSGGSGLSNLAGIGLPFTRPALGMPSRALPSSSDAASLQGATPTTSPEPATSKGARGAPTTGPSPTLMLIPPGRALAELFCRELELDERPSPSQISQALPGIITQNFGLAASASIGESDGTVQVRMLHPIFHHSCRHPSDGEGSGVIGCSVCSFLAVLFCYSSGRTVLLKGCSYDEESDTSTASIVLGHELGAKGTGV